jgi:hypothetical protein
MRGSDSTKVSTKGEAWARAETGTGHFKVWYLLVRGYDDTLILVNSFVRCTEITLIKEQCGVYRDEE